jgi:hypothetical protein
VQFKVVWPQDILVVMHKVDTLLVTLVVTLKAECKRVTQVDTLVVTLKAECKRVIQVDMLKVAV